CSSRGARSRKARCCALATPTSRRRRGTRGGLPCEARPLTGGVRAKLDRVAVSILAGADFPAAHRLAWAKARATGVEAPACRLQASARRELDARAPPLAPMERDLHVRGGDEGRPSLADLGHGQAERVAIVRGRRLEILHEERDAMKAKGRGHADRSTIFQ